MINLYINNVKVSVPRNSSVLEACEYAGISVPRFCYHERLNVAGNCRMCLVEIEKAPKPVASCAFPTSENMRVYTNTPLVHKARENVLEFLLINHPLDCPICDQGGECDLQEQTLTYGSDRSRFFFQKRGVEDKNCGPLIKTIMTRCIHCTRCVRFFQEIAASEDLGTTARGKETEIGTYIKKNLNSELSGNIIDLCPVGALTSKPYAFTARPWELKSVDSIDTLDGVGSNIKINFKETEITRILPRTNDAINDEWISDKTRFIYDSFKLNRIGFPYSKGKNDTLTRISWKKALTETISLLKKSISLSHQPTDIVFVGGSLLDLKTLAFLKTLASDLNVKFLKEENLAINNLLPLSRSNTSLASLEDSDLLLTVGSNPRFEASMYDMKIKVRTRAGLFTRASIGVHTNYTYDNISLGATLKTLYEILEGKHPFCKELASAKKPVVVFNSGIYKLLNTRAMSQVLRLINKNCKVINEEWFGFDVLSPMSNYSDLNASYFNNSSLKQAKFAYLVGVSDTKSVKRMLGEQTIIVQQAAISNGDIRTADVILPNVLSVEKSEFYLNLENRVQKTSQINTGPGMAQSDLDILTTIQKLLRFYKTSTILEYTNVTENKLDFSKDLFIGEKAKLTKLNFAYFKSQINNFFNSDLVSKNSMTLNKCAKDLKESYVNFLK